MTYSEIMIPNEIEQTNVLFSSNDVIWKLCDALQEDEHYTFNMGMSSLIIAFVQSLSYLFRSTSQI